MFAVQGVRNGITGPGAVAVRSNMSCVVGGWIVNACDGTHQMAVPTRGGRHTVCPMVIVELDTGGQLPRA